MKRMFLTMALAITASVFSAQAQDVITDPVAQQAQQEAIKAQKAAEKEAKKGKAALAAAKKELTSTITNLKTAKTALDYYQFLCLFYQIQKASLDQYSDSIHPPHAMSMHKGEHLILPF